MYNGIYRKISKDFEKINHEDCCHVLKPELEEYISVKFVCIIQNYILIIFILFLRRVDALISLLYVDDYR